MNLKDKHAIEKPVSATALFKGDEGTVTSLQIRKDGQLKEHITKVAALLVCVVGEVVFENEHGMKEILQSGDYVNIEPYVKHWVIGKADSQLLLFK